ncbi:MAG TPA: hypothetical protein VNE41_00715 [Chitinophagaceae bacterium]|nr:hypothetical protein [Chitinophagaceae bacterium]
MLTPDEIQFLHAWENAILHKKKIMFRKILPGFMWGFILGCASILPPFMVMEKRQLGISGGTLVIFMVSVIGIGVFVGFLRWQMYWDKNEGLYEQLKKRQDMA